MDAGVQNEPTVHDQTKRYTINGQNPIQYLPCGIWLDIFFEVLNAY